MMTNRLFDAAREGDTLVISPLRDISRLYEDNLDLEINDVLDRAQNETVRHVVIDFGKIEYFGSSMLGAMVALWKQVKGRDGQMAVCNVSDTCSEILHAARLDEIWPRCSSREEAIGLVQGASA